MVICMGLIVKKSMVCVLILNNVIILMGYVWKDVIGDFMVLVV